MGIMKTYNLGGGAFAVTLAEGKMLVGFGDVAAPSPSLILNADQLAELAHALDTRVSTVTSSAGEVMKSC